MRCAQRIDDPAIVFPAGDQCADAYDRVVYVLGKLVPHGRTDVIFTLAVVTIGGGEALDVRNRFDVPYDDAGSHATPLNGATARKSRGGPSYFNVGSETPWG